jgi:periplasmic mercuric ion binding protein
MKYIILSICSMMMLQAAYAQDQKIVIKTTVQCDECKTKVEDALLFEKGIRSAEVNIDSQEVSVIYNPEKTDPDKIRKAISLVGYDADSIPADPKAYKRLKPCCSKDGHKD